MADRGSLGVTPSTPATPVGPYQGLAAAFHPAHWNSAEYLHYGGGDGMAPVPKTTGQIWPRGEQ